MTENSSAASVLSALSDPSPVVRSNVYDALLNYSAIRAGVNSLMDAGYAPVLVEKAGKETDDVRHMPLNLLYNVCKVRAKRKSRRDKSRRHVFGYIHGVQSRLFHSYSLRYKRRE